VGGGGGMCPDKKKHLVRAFAVSVKWWLLRWRRQAQLLKRRGEMRERPSDPPRLQRGAPVCFVTVNSILLTLLDLIK